MTDNEQRYALGCDRHQYVIATTAFVTALQVSTLKRRPPGTGVGCHRFDMLRHTSWTDRPLAPFQRLCSASVVCLLCVGATHEG